MSDAADALSWPVRDRRWRGRLLGIGLLSLVPVLGAINLVGWSLCCLDLMRAGEPGLAPVGFHLRRGLRVTTVMLVYTAAAAALVLGVFLAGVGAAAAAGRVASPGLAALAVMLLALASSMAVVADLTLCVLTPPVVIATERGGIRGGLNVGGVWRLAGENPGLTVNSGLMILIGGLVGSLGLMLCLVGVALTVGYGYAVMAAVCRSFELGVPASPPGRGSAA